MLVNPNSSLLFSSTIKPKISSVQFSRSVVSDSLRPHESQHTRLPCPLPTPAVFSNSCQSSWWCHPTISSPVIPFSCQFFALGGQSIGVSASESVLPMSIQDWFPLGLTALLSLSPRDSQESSLAPQFESISSLVLTLLYGSTLTSIHDY